MLTLPKLERTVIATKVETKIETVVKPQTTPENTSMRCSWVLENGKLVCRWYATPDAA